VTLAAAMRYDAFVRLFPARALHLGALVEPTLIYQARTLNEPPPWADIAIVTVDTRKLRRIVARWARSLGFTCTGPSRTQRRAAYHHRHATPYYSLPAPMNPINAPPRAAEPAVLQFFPGHATVLTKLYINAPRIP